MYGTVLRLADPIGEELLSFRSSATSAEQLTDELRQQELVPVRGPIFIKVGGYWQSLSSHPVLPEDDPLKVKLVGMCPTKLFLPLSFKF